jgi:hypothetical protein
VQNGVVVERGGSLPVEGDPERFSGAGQDKVLYGKP